MKRCLRRAAIAAGAVILLLVVAGMIWLPYRPVRVAGAPPPPAPHSTPTGVPGLRLHVFNTGANRMSPLLVGPNPPWRPAPAFAIEHPTQGLVVFDCGLSEEVARDGEAALGIPMRWLFESRGRPGRTLDAQMREAGMDPEAVRWVVISHLHDDHVGASRAFRNATFVGGAGVAGHALPGGFAPRWRELDFARQGSPYPPFDSAIDLFGDGSVRLIRGGGHTHEDVLALIALPGGPALLAGDAVVHREWLASDDVERIAVDPERAADVRNVVRSFLAALPAVVFVPGHDLRGLPRDREDVVLHHPEWFEVSAWPIVAAAP